MAAVYFGQAEREHALIPPGLPGFWEDAPHYERDITKAKEYLGKAGLQSLDITYSCSNTTEAKAQAEIVQQNLAEVGINVTIDAIDASSYWQAGMGDNGIKLELYATGFSMSPILPGPRCGSPATRWVCGTGCAGAMKSLTRCT